jgi:NAD(P)-dependent dehydrogenase (short-subunit alcohol dehydrogenase family)
VKLQGRVALIVGGASGLGRASAQACAEQGAKVMIADIAEVGAKQVVSEIDADGGSAAFISTDITDEASVKRAVESTVRQFGRLDILVTSAGGGGGGDEAAWHFAIDIYLKGPFYACKYAVQEMERLGGGVIVNISSIAGVTGGIFGSVDQTGYPCAKHGVVGLTRTIALSYAKKNIRANVVCPGYIRTGMTKALYDTPDGGQALISDTLRVPLDRWGEPDEIGKVVAFLASDDASYITGQPIIVDGGIMAR